VSGKRNRMKVDIPTKAMVKRMVDIAIRIEMSRISKILDRFRKRFIQLQRNKRI